MNESTHAHDVPGTSLDWSDHLRDALSERRDATRAFLAAQETRLAAIEQRLTRQRDALVTCHSQWGRVRQLWTEAETNIQEKTNAVACERNEVTREREELSRERDALVTARDELSRERDQLATERDTLSHERDRVACERDDLSAREQAIAEQLRIIENQRHDLEEQAATLAQQEARLGEQREQIAEKQKQVGDQADLICQLQARIAQLTTEFREIETQASSELDAARVSLMNARRDQEQLRRQLETASRQYEQQLAERDVTIQQLQQRASEIIAESSEAHETDEWEQLRIRYETALDEVRALQSRNDELEATLASGDKQPAHRGLPSGPMDWETQKRLLMEQLDHEDIGEDAPARMEERLTIKQTLRATEQAIAEKNAEIAELQKRLKDNTGPPVPGRSDSVVFGAQGIAAFLDQDELIQAERENLQRLQDEWRDKLRQAEVELSVERARLARERLELEDRARDLERLPPNLDDASPDRASEKLAGRRWLTHLGLGGNDD